jgi:hypothetical protein
VARFNTTDIIKEIALDAYIDDKIVICFDDIERAHVEHSKVLGYINNLIENKSAKIIILGNQSEILDPKILKDNSEKNVKNYLTIKEKCIRWTFDLEPEVDKVFKAFYGLLADSPYKRFLKNKKDYICNLFHTQKIYNFRTMKFYLEILEKMYPIIHGQDDIIQNEAIFYSFVCVAEGASGMLNTSNIEEFKNLRNDISGEEYSKRMKAMWDKDNAEKTATPKTDYWGKYFRDKNYPFYEYLSIIDFVVKGTFNGDKFKVEIDDRKIQFDSKEDELFNKIATPYFRNYSDDDFKHDIGEFIQYIKAGKYELYHYVMISYWMAFYSKNGFVKLSKAELLKILNAGMNKAAKNQKPDSKACDFALTKYNDYPDITKPVKAFMVKLHGKLAKNELTSNIEDLYVILTKSSINYEQIDVIFEKNNSNVNFIYDLNARKLAEALVDSSVEKIHSFKFNFWEYLAHGHFNNDYDKILSFIKTLKKEISARMKNLKNKPVSKFNLKELVELFDNKFIPALINNRHIPLE